MPITLLTQFTSAVVAAAGRPDVDVRRPTQPSVVGTCLWPATATAFTGGRTAIAHEGLGHGMATASSVALLVSRVRGGRCRVMEACDSESVETATELVRSVLCGQTREVVRYGQLGQDCPTMQA